MFLKKAMPSEKLGALDIGSNTIRLLVAELDGDRLKFLHSSQIITRLGEGMHSTGLLADKAMERAVDGIESLIDGASKMKPYQLAAVATHAVRNAGNKADFQKLLREKTGLDLNIIGWETEAELSLKGVETVIETKGKSMLLFDIGGGSTEFIYKNGDGDIRQAGTSLGVVPLAETFISKAPLIRDEFGNLKKYLKGEIETVKKKLDIKEPFMLVGTAGSVTSIAAMQLNLKKYDHSLINNAILGRNDVETLLKQVAEMTIEELGEIASLKNGREDLIIPGFGIILSIMENFDAELLTVSDAGLREGILLAVNDGLFKGTTL